MAGRPRGRSSSPGVGKNFFFSKTESGVHATSYPMETGDSFPGGKGRPARRADNLEAICEPIV
jgi:hypothetical protein